MTGFEDDAVSEETIRQNLTLGFRLTGKRDRRGWPPRPRPHVPVPRQPPPVFEEWLGPWEDLVWQAFGKRVASQEVLDYWVSEWQGTGMSIEQAREWVSMVHPTYPQPAGNLQAAGITAYIAFRPILRRGENTHHTLYSEVASGRWTVERAVEMVQRAEAKRREASA